MTTLAEDLASGVVTRSAPEPVGDDTEPTGADDASPSVAPDLPTDPQSLALGVVTLMARLPGEVAQAVRSALREDRPVGVTSASFVDATTHNEAVLDRNWTWFASRIARLVQLERDLAMIEAAQGGILATEGDPDVRRQWDQIRALAHELRAAGMREVEAGLGDAGYRREEVRAPEPEPRRGLFGRR